ncbi:putative amino acid permease [Escherichia coli]|uniref:Putative amino acid permease n=1 Tax=Escherichia coli TaxID=562 RepID=A0A376L0P0_ECOLX|nr:putative amino acid permease [Escherichia coli]
MTLFNSLSNHAVGRLEVILVGIKMMILLLLIIAGVWSLQPAHISVSAPPSSGAFFSCIGITFLAYAGFGMMANAADKVKDPQVIMAGGRFWWRLALPRCFISRWHWFCLAMYRH